jgi:hypothetical protein
VNTSDPADVKLIEFTADYKAHSIRTSYSISTIQIQSRSVSALKAATAVTAAKICGDQSCLTIRINCEIRMKAQIKNVYINFVCQKCLTAHYVFSFLSYKATSQGYRTGMRLPDVEHNSKNINQKLGTTDRRW